jgi:hypothetical protein
MNSLPRSATILSLFSASCAAAASVTTLGWDRAFPDPSPAPAFNGVLAEGRGWSAVTLGLVIPMLLVAMTKARHGSLRARLVWLGGLAYLVYTYLEMAVSGPFTPLYLIYIAAFACAIPALIMGVRTVEVESLPRALGERFPRRTIAIYALTFGVLLAAAWIKDIAARTIVGQFGWPDAYGSVRNVVQALDLGLQVPLLIAAGILLLRHRSSGYLVAAIAMVNAVCMSAALVAMVGWSAVVEGKGVLTAAPFAALFTVTLAMSLVFFRNGDRAERHHGGLAHVG